MAINQGQITPNNGAAQHDTTLNFVPGQTQTDQPIMIRQMRSGFMIQSASAYCRSLTPILSANVGRVPVGLPLTAVTLTIATTTTSFKINSAQTITVAEKDLNTGLPTILRKGVTDNLAFSAAYKINQAAATGQFWGAFRVQIDAAGVVSTKAYAMNQVFLSEADALLACPAPDPLKGDLGTISVQSATGATWTANTTALNAAGTTVHYNGAASGFISALDDDMDFVALTFVQGVMEDELLRRTATPGELLVVRYTSDGSMVVTDASVNINVRPFPMNNEAPGE